MTAAPPEFRRQFPRVVAFVCLAALSTFVVVDHIRVRTTQTAEAKARVEQAAALASQLEAIDRRLDSITQQPPSVSESRFASSSRTLEARLARVEQSTSDIPARQDLTALDERIKTLEARVRTQMDRSPPRPDHTENTHQRPDSTESPPFTPIGTEMRGGEQFLSLIPPGAHSSAEARVLHLGDSEGDWTLDAIEGRSAVFSVHGRTQRITWP